MTGRAPLGAAAAARLILDEVGRGGRVAALLYVGGLDQVEPGGRIVLTADGRVRGTLGDDALDRAAAAAARDALAGRTPFEGTVDVDTGRGTAHVYVEVHEPTPELIIVGAGHIARPLCTVGALLGFDVRVLDDRPEFATTERFPEARRVASVDFSDPFRDVPVGPASHVVLVTRGHKYDYECLRRVLAMDPPPAYLGMIGSRRRVRATFAQLLDEGIPEERLATVRAPLGLDLGAQTPVEIAVAVAAEIVAERRGGTGAPLSGKERILQRFFTS